MDRSMSDGRSFSNGNGPSPRPAGAGAHWWLLAGGGDWVGSEQ